MSKCQYRRAAEEPALVRIYVNKNYNLISVLKEKKTLMKQQQELKDEIKKYEENFRSQMKNSKKHNNRLNVDTTLLENISFYGKLTRQCEDTKDAVLQLEEAKLNFEKRQRGGLRRHSWAGTGGSETTLSKYLIILIHETIPSVKFNLEKSYCL